MFRSMIRGAALAAGLAVALAAAASASESFPHGPVPGEPDAGFDVPTKLSVPDVVRLTEEARWLMGERKLATGPAVARALTAHPHAGLADSLHSYDAIHYRLDVTPSRTSNLISGTMTLDLQVVDPGITHIDLHAVGLSVAATRVNGTARTFSVAGDQLLIPICQGANCPPHGAGAPLQVAVDYSSSPPAGFYYYPRNSYTLAEPYDARYWWPCYDLPHDKATLDVYATVPDTNVCLSNGVLVAVTAGPPGKKIYHWQETHPLATYLVAISVGNFWQWTQMAGSLPILEAVFPEDSLKAKFDFANIPAMVPIFAARWGPYAFDKYGQVAVTPFGAGGMEHQSMTTINRSWVTGTRSFEGGMAHELAHQWWGDMVTLVDFRNIWLNEGFASYGECQWQEDFYGPAAYDAIVQAQMTSALNSDNSFRYRLYDPPPANLFGNTIYKKGSLVLHMLRRVLGDAPFFAGMQLYGQRFRYGSASTADFQEAMEDASGQALAWYFNEWVYDQGLPTYNWGWQSAAGPLPGQTRVGVQIRQVQTNAPLFRMPVELLVQRGAGSDTTVKLLNNALASESFVFTVNGTVTNVVFDPRNSIYKRIQQVAVDVPAAIPAGAPTIALTASPNPSRGATRLTVRLAGVRPQRLDVSIYDSAGRLVRTLGRSRLNDAAIDFVWDLRDRAGDRVAPGLYFAQARAGANHEERPLVVLE